MTTVVADERASRESVPFWTVASPVGEVGRPDLQLLSVFLDRGVIRYNEGGGQVHKPSLDLNAYQVVRPGDLVLNNQQAWRGSLGVSRHLGIISPAYVVRRLSTDVNPTWGDFYFRSPEMVSELRRASRGVGSIQRQLHLPSLRRIKVSLPLLDEQVASAKYLNHLDLAIARAIHAKQNLVRLIDELSSAVRWRIVAASGKSGACTRAAASWMGPVPETWELTRLKDLLCEVDARSRTGSEPLLSLRMREGLVPASGFASKPQPEPADLVGYKIVTPGDLVVNRMRASIGLFGVAMSNGLVSPDYATFQVRPRAGVHLPYLLLLLKSLQMGALIRSESRGLGTGSAGFLRIYTDRFGALSVVLPSVAEQMARAEEALARSAAFEQAIAAALREIDVLREYRTKVISDVVIGRRDVQAGAAALPEIDTAELDAVRSAASPDDDGAEDIVKE